MKFRFFFIVLISSLIFTVTKANSPLPEVNCHINADLGDGDELTHVDYLPRYRKTNLNVLITKIEYHTSKMILYFRFIADQKAPVKFYGKNTANAWALESPSRPGPTSQQAIRKNADVHNIRINDQLQIADLPADDEVTYTPDKGDIVSCEIHVENLPHFIKVVNLVGGEIGTADQSRFGCTDLMLKTADNRTLGNSQQMETLINNFYQEFKYIKYPDIKEVTSLDQERKFAEKKNTTLSTTPIKNSMKPIDYMPTMLNSVEDLQCRERVILQNVYFDDNSAEFTKRVQAMKTINVVFNYLEQFPDSKIVLHGHTDIFGDPYKNLVLSKERVLEVKRVLIQKGIDKRRIITLYHGGSQPLPRYKDGDPMNRRVEVEVICKDDAISVKDMDSGE